MINPGPILRQAYYDALDGSVNVFKEDVLIEEDGLFVVVSLESQNYASNNQQFVNTVVVIVEVCGVDQNQMPHDAVEAADQTVVGLLKATVPASLDTTGDDLQIVDMRPANVSYLSEDDGTKKYYRKITRWTNRVVQL